MRRHPQDALDRLRKLARSVRLDESGRAAQIRYAREGYPELDLMLTMDCTGRHSPGFHGARMGGPRTAEEIIMHQLRAARRWGQGR